jgi:hypothetical protein
VSGRFQPVGAALTSRLRLWIDPASGQGYWPGVWVAQVNATQVLWSVREWAAQDRDNGQAAVPRGPVLALPDIAEQDVVGQLDQLRREVSC